MFNESNNTKRQKKRFTFGDSKRVTKGVMTDVEVSGRKGKRQKLVMYVSGEELNPGSLQSESDSMYRSPGPNLRGQHSKYVQSPGTRGNQGIVEDKNSPQYVQKQQGKPLFARTAKVLFDDSREKEGSQPVTAYLFGQSNDPQPNTARADEVIEVDHNTYDQLESQGYLTSIPIKTVLFNITTEQLKNAEPQTRSKTQDAAMGDITANEHMNLIGYPKQSKRWEWGHLVAYVLNQLEATPDNLMVVSPIANILESQLTAALREASKVTEVEGSWSIQITADRVKAQSPDSDRFDYLKHVSHKQTYCYTFVPQSKNKAVRTASNSLEVCFNPISYAHATTANHKKVFESWFRKRMNGQSLIDYSQMTIPEGFKNQEERAPLMQVQNTANNAKHNCDRKVPRSLFQAPVGKNNQGKYKGKYSGKKRSRAGQETPRSNSVKVSYEISPSLKGLSFQEVAPDGHCFFHAVSHYVTEDMQALRQLAAQHMQNNRQDYLSFYSGGQEAFDAYLKKLEKDEWADQAVISALEESLQRPIIIISAYSQPVLTDNSSLLTKDPIFVHYEPSSFSKHCNGSGHYSALTVESGHDARAILGSVQAAIHSGLPVRFEKRQRQSANVASAYFFGNSNAQRKLFMPGRGEGCCSSNLGAQALSATNRSPR